MSCGIKNLTEFNNHTEAMQTIMDKLELSMAVIDRYEKLKQITCIFKYIHKNLPELKTSHMFAMYVVKFIDDIRKVVFLTETDEERKIYSDFLILSSRLRLDLRYQRWMVSNKNA